MKIPLSWFQLTHEKMRFIVALAGITFADVLMFMQLGFRDALFDSSVRFHKGLKGDIILISTQSNTLIASKKFSSRYLYGITGIQGVKSVNPIYLDIASWKNLETKKSRSIFVYGFNPINPIIDLPGVSENLQKIKQPDVVLFDQKSRGEFGPVKEEFNLGKTVITEVSDRKIKVGGLFSLGTSFGADGSIITSDVNFFRLYPNRTKGLIDLGIIQLQPGANLEKTLTEIRQRFPRKDIEALSKQEFIDHEKNYWQKRTTIGFIFTLGTIMGFIVGIVIVYQILYTDVADHLPEYATLKAMGYTDYYLLAVVFQEAIILACVGFIPGFSLAMFLYFNTAKATGLPIMMTVARATTVLILTVIMCVFSGTIAVGKLRAADPADIF